MSALIHDEAYAQLTEKIKELEARIDGLQSSPAKPILLMGFPSSADMSLINGAAKSIDTYLNREYHVLAYATSKVRDIQFNVLNVIRATDLEVSELLTRVENFINESQRNATLTELDLLGEHLIKNNQQ